ncbi:HNH/ENDO VII family nuclease, partial [Brachybacterium conglomeratum]
RDGVGAMVGWDGAEAAAGGDGWHQWKDDPVAMGTQVGMDAVLIAVPIGGWAFGAGKAGLKGSRAATATRGGKTTRVAGGALDFLVPGGGRLVEGASTVFSKRLSASGSRTSVLDEVDLTETAPPAVPRDRTATDDSSPTGADGDTTPLRDDRTGGSSTAANDERAAGKDSTDDSTTTEVDRTDGSRETVREHAPADTPSTKEAPESESVTMTERERGEARAQEAAAAVAEERRRPGTAATTYRPSTYEGPSGRETKAHKGIMSRPTPGEAQAALDRAPQNKYGQPVDHRNGRPLLLEDTAGRRGWTMRWDPDAREWVAENRSLAGHGMDAKGIPNSYGYDANGDLLPYANHRPSYRPGQVEDVWTLSREELAPRLREGGDLADLPPLRHENEMWVQVRDDSGAEDVVDLGKDRGKWRRIEWYPGQSRLDVWDMGHIPKQKYAAMHDRYMRGQMTTEEFLAEYRDESNYRVEDPPRNRSHVDEKRRVSG